MSELDMTYLDKKDNFAELEGVEGKQGIFGRNNQGILLDVLLEDRIKKYLSDLFEYYKSYDPDWKEDVVISE